MTGTPLIELLVVPNCPNEQTAAQVLRLVLDQEGFDDVFETVVISTRAQAQVRAFTGFPSFYLNGHDLLPDAATSPALACRLYQTEAGDIAGIPDSKPLPTPSTGQSEDNHNGHVG